MKSAWFIVVIWILYGGFAHAASPDSAPSDFGGYVNGMLDQPTLRGSSWSVMIYSLDGDSTFFERDADRRLIPASVAKVATSAAALDALGPDFRFETTLSSVAPISADGSLHGDLIVQGGGDPMIGPRYLDSLRAPVLKTWADILWARGLRRVEGNLVMRTWPFQLQAYSPVWEVGDVNDRFGPPVDGFGFNSNVCQLAIFPGSTVGAEATFSLDPPYAPVNVRSSVVTAPGDVQPSISFRLVPEDTIVYISGEIPLGNSGQYLWVAIQNPSLFFARALQRALQDVGINVSGGPIIDRGGATEPGTTLFTYRSPPLSEVIKLMNKESDNFVAESVLRVLGVRINKVGDLRASLDAEARFLRELGVGENAIELHDGCGLARQDLCSARGLVEVLKAMYVHPSSQAYVASMAVSGVDGTIGFRMSSPELIGKVHAKTGTINHVSNLTGYLFGEDGQVFLFAILCNNFPSSRRQNVRGIQDTILERLYAVTAGNYSTSDR